MSTDADESAISTAPEETPGLEFAVAALEGMCTPEAAADFTASLQTYGSQYSVSNPQLELGEYNSCSIDQPFEASGSALSVTVSELFVPLTANAYVNEIPCEWVPSETADMMICAFGEPGSGFRVTTSIGFYTDEIYDGALPHRLPDANEMALLTELATKTVSWMQLWDLAASG